MASYWYFDDGDDIFDGTFDDDMLYGYGGNDSLRGQYGNDSLLGGDGNDTLEGENGDDLLFGEAGNDQLYGGEGKDILNGGVGNDLLDGGWNSLIDKGFDGDDNLAGGDGNDTLLGRDGNDILSGDGGDDNLEGGSGYDHLTGGLGNDILNGGIGVDTMVGGLGNDTYYVDTPGDSLDETTGGGIDTVISTIDYILPGLFENLFLTDTAQNATGNILGNTLKGNDQNNALYGLAGNDVLDGGAGADFMVGGIGNDTYWVDDSSDFASEKENEGTDTIISSIDYSLDAFIENLTLAGDALEGDGNSSINVLQGNSHANILSGFSGADGLYGLAGNDVLDGGIGADNMYGGTGDDTYVVDTLLDKIFEIPGEGCDTVSCTFSYTLSGANIENLVLGGAWSISGTGNIWANTITGNSGDNIINGLGAADTMKGGEGDDIYYVDNSQDIADEEVFQGRDKVYSSVNYILDDQVEELELTGTLAINGTGNALDNILRGNTNANIIFGYDGSDMLYGGAGNDILNGGENSDTLSGEAGNDTLWGDVGDDTLQGGSGNDTLYGQADDDSMYGEAGADILDGGDGNDYLYGDGASYWDISASFGNDILYGGAGNDVLVGGQGADTMRGGSGNDQYFVDNIGDILSEQDLVTGQDEGGIDKVYSILSTFTLGNYFEVLQLSSQANAYASNGIGNSLVNGIFGNKYRNTIEGKDGDDRDIVSYYYDSSASVYLAERATLYGLFGNDGNDTLHGNNGVDDLHGGQGNDYLYGGAGDDRYAYVDYVENDHFVLYAGGLYGDDGNDFLFGGEGSDYMAGGNGDDHYEVDTVSDEVVEKADEGSADTVTSLVSYILPDYVENLTLVGSGLPLTGTGNALDNFFTGCGTANLKGGAGNDMYLLSTFLNPITHQLSQDTVFEAEDEGTNDTIKSTLSFDLGTSGSVENLILLGVSNTVGTGNDLNNLLVGNDSNNTLTGRLGNDTLNGGKGVDIMLGGIGNDTYWVDNTSDVVTEVMGAGNDMIYSTVNITLAAGSEVEVIRLTGIGTIQATGNEFDNVIYGNSRINILNGGRGNDELYGGLGNDNLNGGEGTDILDGGGNNDILKGDGGNDSLDGGPGNDTLTGGAGADDFGFTTVLNATTNKDTITDFSSGSDTITLANGVFGALGGGVGAGNFVLGAKAMDGDDYLIYNQTSGALFYDADGNKSGVAIQFASLSNKSSLMYTDFIVV